jgi:uncharacterized protein YgbK (DUF1537 family)
MSSCPQVIIIADDLTGAADAAAGIAARGLVTFLPLARIPSAPTDALVFTTESRALSRDQAVRKTRDLVARLKESGSLDTARIVYKKIDSTLRGHPAAELTTLMEETGSDRALVAPAFPAQGRTTIGSRQFVAGVRLENTEFGRAIETSDLTKIFADAHDLVTPLSLEEIRSSQERLRSLFCRAAPYLVLADAETEDDLVRLAQAASAAGLRLFCGSAGLISALLGLDGWTSEVPAPDLPSMRTGPGLVVAGSRHARTREQIRFIESKGAVVLRVAPRPPMSASEFSASVRRASRALQDGQHVVLALEEEEDASPDSTEVARLLAGVCLEVVRHTSPAFLALTGGDTATAVCNALDVSAIRLLGEIAPGIPQARLQGGVLSDLPVATKAGGFGGPDALAVVLQYFQSGSRV